LPIATTQSPTRALSESPNSTNGSGFSRLHTQQREVRAFVPSDHAGLQGRVVLQRDVDFIGAVDHVIVGDDQAVGVDDEAGPKTLCPPLWAARGVLSAVAGRAVAVEEIAEELLER
jgi:hypothetical protein